MKINKTILWIMTILLASSLLAGCAGGVGMTSSWPGVAVDEQSEAVYVAHGTHIYALNLANGTEKWRFPVEADNKLSFYAEPTLTSDGQLIAGAYNNSLYSLNPQNGQQNWVFSEAADKYIGQALSLNGLILAPNNNHKLYALNSNGSLKWTFQSDQSLWAMPLTDGELVYLASMDHHIYAIDPETGDEIWKTEDLGGAVVNSFALDAQEVVYAGTLGEDLVAVNMSDGEILWTAELQGWVWSQAVSSNGTLFAADQEGIVYALETASGKVLWQIQPDTGADRAILSTPVLVNDTLYFASQAGVLYAVDALSGSSRWNKMIGGHIYADLKTTKDLILVAVNDFDSLLVGVDLQGNNRWSFAPSK